MLNRTEMVVVSKQDLRDILSVEQELNDYELQKIGESTFTIQPQFYKKPFDKKIIIYAIEKDLHHKILFITDTIYLIHKIKLEEGSDKNE